MGYKGERTIETTQLAPNTIPFQRSRRRAPHEPNNLVAEGDYTGITLSWQQRGTVDGWTVYCDPLDGSETDCAFVTEPRYRFGDLSPGEHHVGVVAWNHGRPSDGEGHWVYAAVEDQPAGLPLIPVISIVDTESTEIGVAWISQDATSWKVRLVDAEHRLVQTCGTAKHLARFTGLTPDTRYGLQVRAHGADLPETPWCEVVWTRTISTSN